jgi:HD-like signal output (HDOD) protein/prolyl-tRNA editing enzyme YbaK/EbsC (Cys-tRNA(Pro) deacylase)
MAIPAVVDTLLREQNIQYDIAAIAGTPENAVQVALLHDGEHRLHVLYPAGYLLDLNALRQQSGWDLRAMSPKQVHDMCQRRNLQHVPAVPNAMGLPTLVDKTLLSANGIVLRSGGDDNVLYLRTDQFQQSLAQAVVGEFAVDLHTLERNAFDAIDDVEQINHAVANFTQLRVKQRLEETLEMPPLPETAQRILKLRVDPHADVRDLCNLVEMDPPLAAQVISWATSPYYGYTGKIKSVHDAVVRVLGFEVVLNLALGLALGKSLKAPKDNPQGFTSYWQQAVYCATAVESLVGCIPTAQRPEVGIAYLTGLLHNFGHLLMAEVFTPYFSTYCRFQEANPFVGYPSIERFLLGITRDQMAGWLLRLWSMPEEVCVGLRYQNDAEYAGPEHQYANLVYVAMRLLRRHGIGNAPLESIPLEVFERLHLNPVKADQAIQHVVDASEEIIAQI